MEPINLKLIEVSTEDLIEELFARTDNALIYLTRRDGGKTAFKRRYKGDRLKCQGLCVDMSSFIHNDSEGEVEDIDPQKDF